MRVLAGCLKPGGHLLIVEPPGHVSRETWQSEMATLEHAGLVRVERPRAEGRKYLALWQRPAQARDC